MKSVLIIEDEKAMAATFEEYLRPDGYTVQIVHNGREGLSVLAQAPVNAVLLDLNLPDMHGFEILAHINQKYKGCAVIIITGEASMSSAVQAMQMGAHDFVPKPVAPERLRVSLKNALERVELKEIAKNYEAISRDNFQDFIGKSPQMQAVYNILENAAYSKASVFITGESGTGKELAARAIHNISARSNRPFEVLNCAAIPHNLLESEIFGHVKGAFTGALSDRQGAADRADGGTLFLDEIGEMPIELQSKLLRFLQSGTFMAVGGGHEKTVDIRFICATNREPLKAVESGNLREDLYYRLNVIPVQLPPLRDRGDDIILLARYFLQEAAKQEGKGFHTFSDAAHDYLLSYDWPGNVRELENIIRRVVVLNGGECVEIDMLNGLDPEKGIQQPAVPPAGHHKEDSFLPKVMADIKPLQAYEKDIILAALEACDGNITQASIRLDINPATIHRKQKQWRSETGG